MLRDFVHFIFLAFSFYKTLIKLLTLTAFKNSPTGGLQFEQLIFIPACNLKASEQRSQREAKPTVLAEMC